MDEVVKKLEAIDTQEASRAVSRLQKRLNSTRDPQLLGDLVDYFIGSGSKQALKVFSSLKDVQSQDFFSKLNDCLRSKTPLRLPVLRLLAHSLNKQTSWMYKIVQHALFTTILHHLKISHDVLVLTSGVLVLAAILPLSPSHLPSHLPDIFQIFADLATVRTSNRLRLAPKPLYLHLDVAVYYLFLQIYALFPCNFFTFLRGRYGPTGERGDFNHYIAPMFNHVRFHPGLVMDSNSTETHGDKWRDMEPDEIATLSLTMCLDISITPSPLEEGSEARSVIPGLHHWEPTSFTESAPQDENNQRSLPQEPPSQIYTRPPVTAPLSDPLSGMYSLHSGQSASDGTPSPVKGVSPRNTRRQQPRRGSERGTNTLLQDVPTADRGSGMTVQSADTANLAGLRATTDVLWSPSMMFGSTISSDQSRHPSISGYNTTAGTVYSSTIPTPSPEASVATSQPSTSHHTPRPMTAPTFTYMNYSPTASLRSESLSRQPSNQTTPSSGADSAAVRQQMYNPLEGEDPFISSSNRVAQPRTPGSGREGNGRRGMPPSSSVSIKNRFERFFSIFLSSKNQQKEFEEFTEISAADMVCHPQRSLSLGAESGEDVRERNVMGDVGVLEEMGVEANEELLISSEEEIGPGLESTPPDSDMLRTEEEEGQEGEGDGETGEVTRFSQYSAATILESNRPIHPASFPGGQREGGSQRLNRQRASKSDSVAHTVQQVQERLKELAESRSLEEEDVELGGDREEGIEGRNTEGCDTPLLVGEISSQSLPESYTGHASRPLKSVESAHTLVARSFDANDAGGPLLTGSLLQERRNSSILMRRVSVCGHSGKGGTQTNAVGNTIDYSPSPVALLDQLVTHGEIIHEGRAQDIPLTELEGIDWFRFGGCPHNEALGQMQSQVAMLHSQLLFERYQCLQHARRNRRLLSKVRNAHRIQEELEYLRHQCWHERTIRQSLERAQVEQAGRGEVERGEMEGGERGKLRSENRALSAENRKLQTDNHKLTVELARLQQENSRLTREAKERGEKLFALESEWIDVQPQLTQTRSLREKVATLEKELLVLSRLYQNQRDEVLSLRVRGRGEHEWSQLTRTLREEKEAAEMESAALQQETEGLRLVVATLRQEGERALEEKRVLQQLLHHVQGRCQQKIKASEEKYEAMVSVTHQLERLVTDLRARSVLSRRKPISHRHQRSSSHPAVQGSSPSSISPSPHAHTRTPPSREK